MSDDTLNYIASLRAASEALRGLRRQLIYLEAEARDLKLDIVSHLIGAAAEEVRERLAEHEAVDKSSEKIAALEITSWARH